MYEAAQMLKDPTDKREPGEAKKSYEGKALEPIADCTRSARPTRDSVILRQEQAILSLPKLFTNKIPRIPKHNQGKRDVDGNSRLMCYRLMFLPTVALLDSIRALMMPFQ
jgi:hypothetical protein